MELGNFSISLTVKDLQASKAFYQKLGFEVMCGEEAQNWLILKNGNHVVGLFQGMFDRNMLTFNPGWDANGEAVDPFTDVREIQAKLEAAGVPIIQAADPNTSGPASLMVEDPDGNPILIDQHR